jgi:hypothetical protein
MHFYSEVQSKIMRCIAIAAALLGLLMGTAMSQPVMLEAIEPTLSCKNIETYGQILENSDKGSDFLTGQMMALLLKGECQPIPNGTKINFIEKTSGIFFCAKPPPSPPCEICQKLPAVSCEWFSLTAFTARALGDKLSSSHFIFSFFHVTFFHHDSGRPPNSLLHR